jgi:hypothetical protein
MLLKMIKHKAVSITKTFLVVYIGFFAKLVDEMRRNKSEPKMGLPD